MKNIFVKIIINKYDLFVFFDLVKVGQSLNVYWLRMYEIRTSNSDDLFED